MGRLIPAGTGMEYYRNVEVENPFAEFAEEALGGEVDEEEITLSPPDVQTDVLAQSEAPLVAE
jgi:hypothetical protein